MTFNAIETRAIEAIRRADHFTASLFLGRGQYRVARRPTVLAAMQAAREIENDLDKKGRLLLRYSGTENLARVMIEGKDQAEIERQANGLADVIRTVLG